MGVPACIRCRLTRDCSTCRGATAAGSDGGAHGGDGRNRRGRRPTTHACVSLSRAKELATKTRRRRRNRRAQTRKKKKKKKSEQKGACVFLFVRVCWVDGKHGRAVQARTEVAQQEPSSQVRLFVSWLRAVFFLSAPPLNRTRFAFTALAARTARTASSDGVEAGVLNAAESVSARRRVRLRVRRRGRFRLQVEAAAAIPAATTAGSHLSMPFFCSTAA